ncbi:MAG: hypothetical protein IKP95_10680 [Ruminococcus sp.]|nr:hypothetical protein [Ruminococcus sp.]
MYSFGRSKRAIVIGCCGAVMLTSAINVNRLSFLFFSRFMPSFAFVQQIEEPEEDDVEYCFGIVELFRKIFG